MGRPQRAAEGGYIYHVLNRANARMTIFDHDGDYEAFAQVLAEAVERTETRLLAYCLMPKPLAPVGLAEEGRRAFAVRRLADPHPHAAVARTSALGRFGPRLSGALQVVPD